MATVMPADARLSFKQLRYLQLMLDNNGDSAVSLQDFKVVLAGFQTAGYVFSVRDEVRMDDVLMRLSQRMRRGVRTFHGTYCTCCYAVHPQLGSVCLYHLLLINYLISVVFA